MRLEAKEFGNLATRHGKLLVKIEKWRRILNHLIDEKHTVLNDPKIAKANAKLDALIGLYYKYQER